MNLEEYLAQLNADVFWREFSFAKNEFNPSPQDEFQFADHVIWIDDELILFQVKERSIESASSPSEERKWFNNKVLKKATKQVRDTLQYLDEHDEINITNQRGHVFNVSSSNIRRLAKVVLFLPSQALPEDCWKKQFHISSTVGFIHVIPFHDYLGICRTLLTPTDIADYLEFREKNLSKWQNEPRVLEQALVGQFIENVGIASRPNAEYAKILDSLDEDSFYLSDFFFNYAEHIADVTGPYEENDYYNILIEFAKLRRILLREAEIRFRKCMEACDKDELRTPYRFASPTDCGFIFIPMQRKYLDARINRLHDFTSLAKYDFRVTKQVGVSFMKDNDTCMVHWCFMEFPWTHDAQIEKLLRENNPFRPVKTRELEHFKLRNEGNAT